MSTTDAPLGSLTNDAYMNSSLRKNPYNQIQTWKFRISYFDPRMSGCDKITYDSIIYHTRSSCVDAFEAALVDHKEKLEEVIKASFYPLE